MHARRIVQQACFVLAALVITLGTPSWSNAQLFTPNAGVAVDANGVLRTTVFEDPNGTLMNERAAAARAALNADVARRSPLRKISLNRLEKAIAEQLAAGRQPTEEMKCLAGLTKIQNVFFYPETGDIVIAGPAEGWVTDLSGRIIGLASGRPIIELQDLVTGLRAFPPGEMGTRMIGCSIDATPEGLARMQQFLSSIGTQADPSNPQYTQFIVDGLRTNLGLQKVRVDGIPPNTHFAQVMVEADYRMKLIGIGLETPPVRIKSYVDLADPATVSRNAMQRWWFVPEYQCVRVTPDQGAMELVGNGVKLMSEDEMVGAGGQRQVVGSSNRASQAFVHGFTQKYPELAGKHQVFGQLRNLIDVTIACAFIERQDYYGRADWKPTTLLDEGKFKVETYSSPVEVETAVASRWKGNRLMTPVGGGVTLHPDQALLEKNVLADDGGKVEQARAAVKVQGLAAGQWWWD